MVNRKDTGVMGKELFGKKIRVTLQETIKPEDTALIIVDMQNDFCSEKGHYGRCGKDLRLTEGITPNLSRLIRRARERGVLLIYVQNTQLPNGAYLSPATVATLLKRWGDDSKLSYTLEGTWGHQVIDAIKPEPTDLIVKKHRPSAFLGTDLDLILRGFGISTIIVTGVVTEGCVESTARDGWLRDYYVVIAEDCIGSSVPELHEAQLKLMKHLYHFVVPSEDLMRAW
jgi:nicotinamidase-related amidase